MANNTTEQPNLFKQILNPRNLIIGTAATCSLMGMPNAYAGAAATGPTPDTQTISTPINTPPQTNNPSQPNLNSLPTIQPAGANSLPGTILPTNTNPSYPINTILPTTPIYNNGGNIGTINGGYSQQNNCGFGANLIVNNSGFNQGTTLSATLFANSARCPDPTRINSVTQNAETQRAQIQSNAQREIACAPLRLEALKSNIDPDKVCPLPKAAREVIINTK